MTTFNWRVLAPNTMRAYEQAARDFECVTGYPVQDADGESIETWKASMTGRGLSVGTIRRRLSAVSVISGVRVLLPKRQPSMPVILTTEQVRKMISIVADHSHRILLVKLLTLGPKARITRQPAETFIAHFMGPDEREMSAQETTRLLKRYARQAGLKEEQVNLRTWCLTGRKLAATMNPAEFVSLLDHRPNEFAQSVQWRPLHGIGRRSVKA